MEGVLEEAIVGLERLYLAHYTDEGVRRIVEDVGSRTERFFKTSMFPVLHATKLPLWTWIQAMYLVVTSSKGISSVVMSRLLGVTQATAWRLGHAIREMMHDRGGPLLSGIVEVDLKYLGGAPKRRKNGQKSKRGEGNAQAQGSAKTRRFRRAAALVPKGALAYMARNPGHGS